MRAALRPSEASGLSDALATLIQTCCDAPQQTSTATGKPKAAPPKMLKQFSTPHKSVRENDYTFQFDIEMHGHERNAWKLARHLQSEIPKVLGQHDERLKNIRIGFISDPGKSESSTCHLYIACPAPLIQVLRTFLIPPTIVAETSLDEMLDARICTPPRRASIVGRSAPRTSETCYTVRSVRVETPYPVSESDLIKTSLTTAAALKEPLLKKPKASGCCCGFFSMHKTTEASSNSSNATTLRATASIQ